ncbi:MAG: hypothetical protein QNK04_01820 [Myxococcota bacterium]|nr:hypothetical protein [Myxococcota bacterium]
MSRAVAMRLVEAELLIVTVATGDPQPEEVVVLDRIEHRPSSSWSMNLTFSSATCMR